MASWTSGTFCVFFFSLLGDAFRPWFFVWCFSAPAQPPAPPRVCFLDGGLQRCLFLARVLSSLCPERPGIVLSSVLQPLAGLRAHDFLALLSAYRYDLGPAAVADCCARQRSPLPSTNRCSGAALQLCTLAALSSKHKKMASQISLPPEVLGAPRRRRPRTHRHPQPTRAAWTPPRSRPRAPTSSRLSST